jgi:hypothetical protein
MPNSLVFIGERPSQLEMHIKGKPEFFDAMLLSKNPSSHLSYQSIPLHQSKVTIYIRENNSQFNCHHQSLQLIEGERPLSEEDAYDIFTNFAIIEDNKVAFIIRSDRKKFRLREKKDPRVLSAQEKMEV